MLGMYSANIYFPSIHPEPKLLKINKGANSNIVNIPCKLFIVKL